MPGTPALPVVTNSYDFLLCMRGCGCVGTRHSPRVSHGKAENSGTTPKHSRRENADTRDPHSIIAREGGRSSIAEELMINRQAAAYWIPAFAGMTGGACDKRKPFAYASAAKRSSFELRASPHDGLLRCARNDTTTSYTRMGPCVPSD